MVFTSLVQNGEITVPSVSRRHLKPIYSILAHIGRRHEDIVELTLVMCNAKARTRDQGCLAQLIHSHFSKSILLQQWGLYIKLTKIISYLSFYKNKRNKVRIIP